MDLERVKNLRRKLTLHFAMIAFLTAILVAAGSGTVFLPVFILLASIIAFVFVDSLEWFELGRIGSAIAMTVVTTGSIASYIYSAITVPSETGQLTAVAGLLVYPEAVLFLQRKNLRVFEQLAVFLLLETVVAALVNDNISFGILLAPILLLWVSALFLFSRYATLVQIDASIETQMPTFSESIYKRFVRGVRGENKRDKIVSATVLPNRGAQDSRSRRRAFQSIPIGIGALVFAGLFFYLLPRTTITKFQVGLSNANWVGLPNRLTFSTVGRILQNRDPVMRVKFTHALSGESFALNSPPYFRALVFNSYGSINRRSGGSGDWSFGGAPRYRDLPTVDRIRNLREFGRELVHVEFDIRRRYAKLLYTLPPVYATTRRQATRLRYDPAHMLLQGLDETTTQQGKSFVYDIGTAAFVGGEQAPVMPVRLASQGSSREDVLAGTGIAELKSDFEFAVESDRYRLKLLKDAGIDSKDRFAAALCFENHFDRSGQFTYSLDLPPTSPRTDPIEDFLLNHRTGHCQYFASAMVGMMRQSGIPSRVVVGYRPTEFNDLGKYFLTRQSDAHAWVEGLFAHDDLVGTEYERWLTDSEDYWVRFDPTPGGDIIQQQGQAFDYAGQLWQEYVVEGQQRGAENGLYAPIAENSLGVYDDLVRQLTQIRDNLRDGRYWSTNVEFAWPLAALVMVLGCAGILLWRLLVLLPRIAPRLASRLGVAPQRVGPRQPFYARCFKLLERLGIRRCPFETPREFTTDAGEILSGKGQEVDRSLDFLTSLYYKVRFGEREAPTPDEKTAIAAELRQLEKAVSAARRSS